MSNNTPHHDGHMFGSNDQVDSAGQPWAGRSFEPNAFADDDGSAPRQLEAALRTFHALDVESEERTRALQNVIDAIGSSRFLIPLVAEAGDVGETAEGLKVDKTQELSVVSVRGPGGQKVLPVFSSVEAMSAWRQDARPVPADGQRVALAAAGDHCEWVVIDPGSDTEIILRRPVLEAIAKGMKWVPNWVDSDLIAIFGDSVANETAVKSISLKPGDPTARGLSEDLLVQLYLEPNLTQDELHQVVQNVSEYWSQQELIASRVDSLKIALIPAS